MKRQTKAYALETQSAGQLLVTLFWKAKAPDLVMVVVCNNEVAGSAIGRGDRFQRLEVGLPGRRVCEIAVSSTKGSSKYWLNVQYTGTMSSSAGGKLQVVSTGSGRFPRLQEWSRPERLQELRSKRR